MPDIITFPAFGQCRQGFRQRKCLLTKAASDLYLNWDRRGDRNLLLKRYFDTYGEYSRTLVTGSARLEMKKRGKGDSLMGRYFPFRMNPLSVGELLRPVMPTADIAMPRELPENDWRALVEFG